MTWKQSRLKGKMTNSVSKLGRILLYKKQVTRTLALRGLLAPGFSVMLVQGV